MHRRIPRALSIFSLGPGARLRYRYPVSFRSVLLALVLGLILASTLATSYFGLGGMRVLIRNLLEKQIATTLDAVTSLVDDHFEPAERLLGTLSDDIMDRRLPTADMLELAKQLADELRFEDGVSWIGYGYPDGRFAAARTENGHYYINISEPGAGQPKEWKILPGGKIEPYAHPYLPSSFDACERPWFRLALEAGGKQIWTPPYAFAHGGRGITSARELVGPSGRCEGVLMVDFLFTDISAYFDRLAGDFRGEPLVFSLSGEVLATPSALRHPDILDTITRKMLDNPPPSVSSNRQATSIIDIPHSDDTYFVGLRRIEIIGGLDCVSAILFRRSEVFSAVDSSIRFSLATAAAALVVSLAVGFFLSGRIAKKLGEIAAEVSRVGNFQLEAHPLPRSSIREVRVLSEAVDRMRTGLQSFARYVPVDLVRDLVRGGGVAELGGERRDVSVLFCDLAGFTTFVEKSAPESASELLTTYFEKFGAAVDDAGGVIDKFLGDGLMALFNAPEKIPSPEAAACRAALLGLRGWLAAVGSTSLGARLGLHCGEVIVGNVGTHSRLSYTAIGDAVNLASRLESLNKLYGTSIIASAALRARAGESEFLWRTLDHVAVAGRNEPLEICELVKFRAEASEEEIRGAQRSDAAAAALFSGDYKRAEELLDGLADAASSILAERIQTAKTAGDSAWSPILKLEKK